MEKHVCVQGLMDEDEDDVGMQVPSFVLDNNRGLCQNTVHSSHVFWGIYDTFIPLNTVFIIIYYYL